MPTLFPSFLAAGLLLTGPCTPARSPAPPAAGTEGTAPAGAAYRSGRLLKVEVLERREGGSVIPATPEGETPPEENPEGRLVTFTIESGGSVYVARCVEGAEGCRAADLASGPVRFRIEGEMLYLERPGGEELAARFAEANR
ncbi:MAG TPA: hypothetical protein VGG03_24665 [Thermoanaerobaculia bacterium]|jgi:hypothetical protein